MGFIYHNYSSKSRANFKIKTKQLKLVTCDDIITLHAEVVGALPPGTTFRWEQKSGTTVVFLEDQNQETVTFRQTNVRDDKVFILFINRGTPLEQQHQVLVTAIPIETLTITDAPESVCLDYGQLEVPQSVMYIMPPVNPGTAKFFKFSEETPPWLMWTGGWRESPRLQFMAYSNGQRRELTKPFKSKYGDTIGLALTPPYDYRTLVHAELDIESRPGSGVIGRTIKLSYPSLYIHDGLSASEAIAQVSSTSFGTGVVSKELFLTTINFELTEELTGITNHSNGYAKVTRQFFARVDPFPTTPEDRLVGITNTTSSFGKVTKTNFIDRSSLGG